ncbi:hypothetical protein CLOM_g3553 [Closterium sp. NIES-68]|nr:hypothetical protein CLOM_g3553 [Closterium sp. NIES-68]
MWHPWRDLAALKLLKPDIILFVGDFGEEQVGLVRQIAAVKAMMGGQVEVAVILGNHDAWFHMFRKDNDPSVDSVDKLTQQIEALGNLHVGYTRIDLPHLHLSIVGARPFSYGPSSWAKSFYRARCGVRTINASTAKITETIRAAPASHSVVVLAHNGPAGLGAHPWDICGKDFPSKGLPPGGDFGDEDLSKALAASLADNRHIPLVVFGHMHRDLFPFNYRSRSSRVSSAFSGHVKQGELVTQRRMTAVLLHLAPPPSPSPPSPSPPLDPQPAALSASSRTGAADGVAAHSTDHSNRHTVLVNAAVVPRIVSLEEEHFTRASGPGLAVYSALGSQPLDPTPGLLLSLRGIPGGCRGAGGKRGDSEGRAIGSEGRTIGSGGRAIGSGGMASNVCRGVEGMGVNDVRNDTGVTAAQVPLQPGCWAVESNEKGIGCGGHGEGEGGGAAAGAAEAVVWEDEVRWADDNCGAVGEGMGGRDGCSPLVASLCAGATGDAGATATLMFFSPYYAGSCW